ncbi:MAG: choice-of-anchor V domain-containing protein [Saprospiraceae bacterium]
MIVNLQKHRIYLFFMLALVWVMNDALKSSNPPLEKTGAPGEQTCSTTPGCHTGGSFTGSLAIMGLPDTIQPDQTYELTMMHMSNAVRTGFQMTALDSLNERSGTFVAGAGSNVASAANGRQYIRQSSAKNLSGGVASWTFSWTAPSDAAGKKTTFYLASNAANGNNNTSGDNALTLTKTVVFSIPSSIDETLASKVSVFPNPSSDLVQITLNEAMLVAVYTQNGQKVFEQHLQEGQHTINMQDWPQGSYLIQLRTKTEQAVKKIYKL